MSIHQESVLHVFKDLSFLIMSVSIDLKSKIVLTIQQQDNVPYAHLIIDYLTMYAFLRFKTVSHMIPKADVFNVPLPLLYSMEGAY